MINNSFMGKNLSPEKRTSIINLWTALKSLSYGIKKSEIISLLYLLRLVRK